MGGPNQSGIGQQCNLQSHIDETEGSDDCSGSTVPPPLPLDLVPVLFQHHVKCLSVLLAQGHDPEFTDHRLCGLAALNGVCGDPLGKPLQIDANGLDVGLEAIDGGFDNTDQL